jgi:mycofactocin glycosyltransferase
MPASYAGRVPRPAVDVVVPFAGPLDALEALARRLARLELRPGDTLLIVDNEPSRAGATGTPTAAGVPIVRAAERRTPGYARNRGAERGSAPWLAFIDADTDPAPDLLDRHFEPEPAEGTAVLGGGVRDEPVPPDAPAAARYAYIRGATSQEDTFRFGEWGFPKTANAVFRRAAFEAVGGFREDIRTAEDADLNYRLKAAGWRTERREQAAVTHLSRATVLEFVRQRAMYGAGGAWLERHYPGSFPARRRLGLFAWALAKCILGLGSAARARDRDRAIWAAFVPLEAVVWELGRSLPNERPLTAAVWWRALRGIRGPHGARRI